MALMRKLKYSYETAENGLIALEKYTEAPNSFFLILMDLNMPIMDGYSATEEIRTLEKKEKLARCSIVALTGVASTQAKQNAFACGIDKFITKPISMKQVKILVQEVLEG